ncbi:MAG TPA: phosphatase PAP2 family protein [Peptococcaceae bacterium]|nr:phosphatase PAP2 family protein [Peptococcaceae bacterium]
MNWLKRFDHHIFIASLRLSTESLTNRWMKRVSRSGNGGAFWLLISAVLLLFESTRQTGGQCIWALLVTTAIGEGLLKHIFRRPRPFVTHGPIHLVIPMPTGFSFPSGHMASSVAAALILSQMGPVPALLATFYATLMGISRIYLKAHYLTDVVVGAVVGFFCGKLSMWLYPMLF